jgi:HEAT repeat protein
MIHLASHALPHRPAIVTAFIACGLFLLCSPLRAVEPEGELPGDFSATEVLDEIHQAAQRPGGEPLTHLEEETVVAWIPGLLLGVDNAYSGEGIRYLALRLTLANTGETPVLLRDENVTLRAGPETFHAGQKPDDFREIPLQIDRGASALVNRSALPPSKLRMPEEVIVPPGRAVMVWCLFVGLPEFPAVPAMTLMLDFDELDTVNVDVNAQQEARLGLVEELAGPASSLGVFRIEGELNTVNAVRLAQEAEAMAARGTERFLVEWVASASPVDDLLVDWLLNSTSARGRGNPLFAFLPPLPNVRELTLARLPEENRETVDIEEMTDRIFSEPADAAVAALHGVYQRLSAGELIREIREGHPWSKQAVLRLAGHRLGDEALPLLIDFANSPDPGTRAAAFRALGGRSHPQAREILITAAGSKDREEAEPALVALLMASDPECRHAVLRLLEESQVAALPRTEIIGLLSEHYRAEWNGYILQSLEDDDAEVRVAAYQALREIGHPDFVSLCVRGLSDPSEPVRDVAFQLLVENPDPIGEEAALAYALELLEEGTINANIMALISRTRDTRAADPLMKLMEEKSSSRVKLIELLGRVGDERRVRVLVERMEELNPAEQVAVLNLAAEVSFPDRLKIARGRLESKSPQVKQAAIALLQQDGGDAAVRMLGEALMQAGQGEVELFCQAIGRIGTHTAGEVLREFRQRAFEQENQESLQAVRQGLRILMAQSPGWSAIEQARYHWQQENWDQAEKYFGLSIEIDDELPLAHSWRGNVYLKKEDYDSARRDFARAMELDPFSVDAVTGLAIVLAIQGEYERGIALIHETASRFPEDNIFAYNAACVYSRAVEQVLQQPESEERNERLAEYRKLAIGELENSVRYGFDDFGWMGEDPDLVPIHDLPRFQELIRNEGL